MQHDVVNRDEWLQARKELLAREKEFTRLRDEMTKRIRSLPWEKVEKSYVFEGPNGREAYDTMSYTEPEIRRIIELAFKLAQQRRRKLTSVDKANVLANSRLWRAVVEEIAPGYPDVELEHRLVDSTAMSLITKPASFDVIVTGNMFGDIITDLGAMVQGGMGIRYVIFTDRVRPYIELGLSYLRLFSFASSADLPQVG